jgi:hypothetical protein
MNLTQIEVGLCYLHIKRLIDCWLADPQEAEHWRLVSAQRKKGGLHFWLENTDNDEAVYDLTISSGPANKKLFLKHNGAYKIRQYTAVEAFREIWRSHWAWCEAYDVDGEDSLIGAFEWDEDLPRAE